MRIISGIYKGKLLTPGKRFTARPTTDFAREGLFNILSNVLDFNQITALDLFSGSGAVSLELISRGCPAVDAVEISPVHAAFLRKSAAGWGVRNLHVIQQDVMRFLQICHRQYDLIFADPPYELPWLERIPEMVLDQTVLAPGGLFVLEHPKRCDFAHLPQCTDRRKYGNVCFSFFRIPA